MARLSGIVIPDVAYHVSQRGNRRLPVFFSDDDRTLYLDLVREGCLKAQVTANDLVAASLRLRPDRIILGELRGGEALAFLRAVNTGHPGSMSTLHADSAQGAIEQITLLALQAGTRLGRADIHHLVRSAIDVFIQLSRERGRRFVLAVSFKSPRQDMSA